MHHHVLSVLLRHFIFRTVGHKFLLIAPAVVLVILALVYGPIAYMMIRSALDPDERQP